MGIHQGLYSVFLSELYESVPRSRVYVMRLEDYKLDKVSAMVELYRWLGLSDPPRNVLNKIKTADIANDHAKKYTGHMDISTTFLRTLDDFYKPYNRELVELLGHEKWSWSP